MFEILENLPYLFLYLTENIGQIIALQPALKFNGGGHINHSIFWENLSPNGGGKPKDDLMDAIKANFRSFDSFLQEMSATTVAIQGSGWGWLGYNPTNDRMKIVTCANQDPLQATTGTVLICITLYRGRILTHFRTEKKCLVQLKIHSYCRF